MAKSRVPYLHRWRNQPCKWENFGRFPGRKQVRLRGDLFSTQFWLDYQAAQTDVPRPEIGASRTKTGDGCRRYPGLLRLGAIPEPRRRYAMRSAQHPRTLPRRPMATRELSACSGVTLPKWWRKGP
jgi:hypothetical protein